MVEIITYAGLTRLFFSSIMPQKQWYFPLVDFQIVMTYMQYIKLYAFITNLTKYLESKNYPPALSSVVPGTDFTLK